MASKEKKGNDAMLPAEGTMIRRSVRQQKQKRSYSPELVKRIKVTKKSLVHSANERCISLFEKKSEFNFCCSKCKSPFIVSPYRKLRRKIQRPSFTRYCVDSDTNRTLPLCNGCGLAAAEKRKKNEKPQIISTKEKEKYFQEAKAFSLSLVETLLDKDAERLFCPEFKAKPCGCLQKYVLGEGSTDQSRERAIELLKLLKEAKQLSKLKFHNKGQDTLKPMAKTLGAKMPRSTIGLGNGQKRSRQFEAFVLKQRRYLREELKFCERASQKVLMYSNNFLHKRLRTEPERVQRVERKKGKAMLGLLKPIAEVATEACCKDSCVLIALSHGRLLQQWRERAALGQAEARRVLAEMLTPSGGIRTNCYKFISLVTGCSRSTIVKVNEQMRLTGGDREPPEHGLKKFWQAQAKKQADKSEKSQTTEDNTLTLLCETFVPSNATAADICTEASSLPESFQSLSSNVERTADQGANTGQNISKVQQGNSKSQQIMPVIQDTLQGMEQHQISFTLPLSDAATLDLTAQPFLSEQVIIDKATQLFSNIGNVIMLHPRVIPNQDSSSIQEAVKQQDMSLLSFQTIASPQL